MIDFSRQSLTIKNPRAITQTNLKSGNQTNSANTWMTFSISLPAGLQLFQSDYIQFQIPPFLLLPNTSCTLSNIVIDCLITNGTVTIRNVGIFVLTQLQVNFTSIQNPSSFEPITGFSVAIIDEYDRWLANSSNLLSYSTT